MRINNWKLFNESHTDSIDIIKMIKANTTSGWKGEQLEESFKCVITEDVNDLKYNGWVEKIQELASLNPSLNTILKLIEENNDDLWTDDLETTFSCVILEDIAVDHETGEYLHKYNGWYERLIDFLSRNPKTR